MTAPAALHPATLRASLALVVIAALTAFALRVGAQDATDHARRGQPLTGALVATGGERDVLNDTVLAGEQAH